jgi:hypothetical protein
MEQRTSAATKRGNMSSFQKTQKQKEATRLMAGIQRHTMLFGGS